VARVLVRVEAKALSAYDEHNQMKRYHRGDWIEIGKQQAREWLELGRVSVPGTKESSDQVIGNLSDCGILIREGFEDNANHILQKHEQVRVRVSKRLELMFDRSLLWKADYPMSPERAALGFVRIEKSPSYAGWECAAMMRGQNQLVRSIGTKEDKQGTLDLLGDLRLPVYETSAIWIRKTRATQKLVTEWQNWLDQGVGDEHAFIRALYQNRIILCTLPRGWLASWV
jgi:hypothetical protein